jgi:hypothetical protein
MARVGVLVGRGFRRARGVAALGRGHGRGAPQPRPRPSRPSSSTATSTGCSAATPIDVAFLALHGRYGEDGAIQGLLEWMGIPYTGSGVLASALAMDKLKAKELFRLHNVPTPPYYDLTGPVSDAQLEERHGSFGFPVMVKPRREGSSIGVSRATTSPSCAPPSTSPCATTTACSSSASSAPARCTWASSATACSAPSRSCPVGPSLTTRPSTASGLCEYYFPARLAPTRYQGVLRLAERAHHALGCTGATRVNVLVTEGENEYVLEVNTLPGHDRPTRSSQDRRGRRAWTSPPSASRSSRARGCTPAAGRAAATPGVVSASPALTRLGERPDPLVSSLGGRGTALRSLTPPAGSGVGVAIVRPGSGEPRASALRRDAAATSPYPSGTPASRRSRGRTSPRGRPSPPPAKLLGSAVERRLQRRAEAARRETPPSAPSKASCATTGSTRGRRVAGGPGDAARAARGGSRVMKALTWMRCSHPWRLVPGSKRAQDW